MKTLFTLLFLISYGCLCSQNLNYKDLTIILSKSNWESVNQYVISKGWKYDKSSEEDVDNYASITWSYKVSDFDDSKAGGWLTLNVSNSRPVKVSYQFHSLQSYNVMKSALIASGMKQISSNIEDNAISVTYSNKSYFADMKTGKTENSSFSKSAVYIIMLKKKAVFNFDVPVETVNTYTTDTTVDTRIEKTNGIEKIDNGDGTYTNYTYVNGKLHGIARTYNSDDQLLEEFAYKNDVLEGSYKSFVDGKLVETGLYKNNKKEGPYRRYENGKVTVSGIYIDEVPSGLHTCYYYPEDSTSLPVKVVGYYKEGKKDGIWKKYVTVKGKDVQYGYNYFADDALNGPSKEVYGDSIVFCNYSNDELNGPYRIYVDYLTKANEVLSGDTSKAYLSEIGQYKEGALEGGWRYFDKYKKLKAEINYKEGRRYGVSRIHYIKEQVTDVITYKDDEIQTETFYYYNTNNLFSGVIRTFSENQAPKEEIAVKDGKRHGITREYNEDGILEKELKYSEGVLQ